MKFDLAEAAEILSRTPTTLNAILRDLPDGWTRNKNETDTWSAFDVIGHLIHGEKTDWIPRARIILSGVENPKFEPFDRFAQFEDSKDKSLSDLLDEFAIRRAENVKILLEIAPGEIQLGLRGVHPELGEVNLEQLLSTWVVHDLTHIRQIATELAKKYEGNVGAWKEYLSILN